MNKMFVSKTINRYNDTGSVKKRHGGGWEKTATSSDMIRKVKTRIKQNPKKSVRKIARKMHISASSVRRILKNLHVKPYKIQKLYALNSTQMKVRLERAKELKRLHTSGEIPNIFSSEKIFIIKQLLNKQNDWVWLTERSNKNLSARLATRSHHPAQMMVWAAVTADERFSMVFLEPSVKVYANNYHEMVLEAALKPWAQKHFGSRPWTFQQDSAPSHKARVN